MIYDTRFMSPAQEFLRKNLFSAVDLSWRMIYIVKKTELSSLNQTFQKSKYLSICGYGALPQRPTKGLSARPLETFGHKYLVFS